MAFLLGAPVNQRYMGTARREPWQMGTPLPPAQPTFRCGGGVYAIPYKPWPRWAPRYVPITRPAIAALRYGGGDSRCTNAVAFSRGFCPDGQTCQGTYGDLYCKDKKRKYSGYKPGGAAPAATAFERAEGASPLGGAMPTWPVASPSPFVPAYGFVGRSN